MNSYISAHIRSWYNGAMEDVFWLWEDFDEEGPEAPGTNILNIDSDWTSGIELRIPCSLE